MEHIYTCKMLNCDIPSTKYEYIYSDNVKLIYKVYRRFDDNMNNRERILVQNEENQKDEENINDYHVIQLSDPLYAVYSIVLIMDELYKCDVDSTNKCNMQ